MLQALALTLCALAAPQSPPAAAGFSIVFTHEMVNRGPIAVRDVEACVAIPSSDAAQAVGVLEWQVNGEPGRPVIVADRYGQKVARFSFAKIEPGRRAAVSFRCDVELRDVPARTLERTAVGELSDIPAVLRQRFTTDVPGVYDLEAPEIAERVRALTRSSDNLFDRVLALHDFVASGLVYQRVGGWDPAPEVLRRGSGSCSEFSYLFGALCRGAGIPTRFVGATENESERPFVDRVWHRWVQVYLPPYGWVDVDPTRNRGESPGRTWIGRRIPRALVVSFGGGGSDLLGDHYVSANNHRTQIRANRKFVWRPRPVAVPAATDKSAPGPGR